MNMNFNTLESRRAFLARSSTGLGALALATLLPGRLFAGGAREIGAVKNQGAGVLKGLNFPAKAKRVIYLFQSGAPSHMDCLIPNRGCGNSRTRNCRRRCGWASASPG